MRHRQISPPVFLVRHGRTSLNKSGRLRGHLDAALDEVGLGQAARVAEALADHGVSRVVSSPLQRAVRTAEAIAARVGVDHEVDLRLIDRDYGEWAGLLESYVIQRWAHLGREPGVEPRGRVVERAREALDELCPATGAGPLVVVAHDAVNRLLLASLDPGLGPAEGIPQDCACWNVLVRVGSDWQIAEINQKAEQVPGMRRNPG